MTYEDSELYKKLSAPKKIEYTITIRNKLTKEIVDRQSVTIMGFLSTLYENPDVKKLYETVITKYKAIDDENLTYEQEAWKI